MKILIAIIIFSAIVLIHEFGHFLLAKKNGIVVTEFSLGMGPRIFSRQKGETRYSVKLLPIGGSCAMLGEDTGEDQLPGTFNAASVWGRISVVAAGPIFNFLLALIFAVIIVAVIGYDPALVMEVEEGSPAAEAGLMPDDVITEYNGYDIDLGKDLYVYTYMNELKEEPVTISFERNGEVHTITFTPEADVRYLLGFNRKDMDTLEVASLMPGMPLADVGVQPGDMITHINGVEVIDGASYEAYISEYPLSNEPIDIVYVRDGLEYEATLTPAEYRTPKLGFGYNIGYTKAKGFEILKYGLLEVKYMIRTTIMGLKELITGGLGVQELSGPVGVVDAIGETYEASKSEGFLIVLMNMMNMAVLLSANLGVMNLLPLPALDGGRLVFLILEAIRRKPINREVEGMVHFAGLMLLMALMVFVMYNDIIKIL